MFICEHWPVYKFLSAAICCLGTTEGKWFGAKLAENSIDTSLIPLIPGAPQQLFLQLPYVMFLKPIDMNFHNVEIKITCNVQLEPFPQPQPFL